MFGLDCLHVWWVNIWNLMVSGVGEQVFCTDTAVFQPQCMPLPTIPLPAKDEIHLWYLNLDELALALSQAFSAERIAAPVRLTPGQLRFARRFYLRLLLGAYLELPGKDVILQRSVRGKPALDRSVHSSPLQFSMAKSDDRVLVGISREIPMGVDLEPCNRTTRNCLRLAGRYFSAAEAKTLGQLPPRLQNPAFLRAWACKEAVVKAYGEGIANQLCRFTVEMNPQMPPAMLDFDGAGTADWSLTVLKPDEDYIAALAVQQAHSRPQCFELHAAR
jgi:4'-phosphopantetheinyl transferase